MNLSNWLQTFNYNNQELKTIEIKGNFVAYKVSHTYKIQGVVFCNVVYVIWNVVDDKILFKGKDKLTASIIWKGLG